MKGEFDLQDKVIIDFWWVYQSQPVILTPCCFLFFLWGFMRSRFLIGGGGASFFSGMLSTFLTKCSSFYFLIGDGASSSLFSLIFFFSSWIWDYLASYSCRKNILSSLLYYSAFYSEFILILRVSVQLMTNPSLILSCILRIGLGSNYVIVHDYLRAYAKCLAKT